MGRLSTRIATTRGVLLMGVLNRTPDSFSDGGTFFDHDAALARVRSMLAEGAALVDVGAESTRPGAAPVSAAEQIARVGTIVAEATSLGAIVSIDTTLPEVAEHALSQGAAVVNSVSLEPAAELGSLCARHGAALVLMHCRGSMSAMQGFSVYADDAYGDVVADVGREWRAAAARALGAGLDASELLLDPGLGFAKNARQSLELVARLDELCALGHAVVAGPSRKSFLVAGMQPAPPPGERLGATIAASLACARRGARVLRVHDVGAVAQALRLDAAVASVTPRASDPVAAKARRAEVHRG